MGPGPFLLLLWGMAGRGLFLAPPPGPGLGFLGFWDSGSGGGCGVTGRALWFSFQPWLTDGS